MTMTTHAEVRAQQRGIPPLAIDLVLSYGACEYDHHGGVIRYFDKRARKAAEKEVGVRAMRRLSGFMGLYAVESVNSGNLITVGHRYKRIHRN